MLGGVHVCVFLLVSVLISQLKLASEPSILYYWEKECIEAVRPLSRESGNYRDVQFIRGNTGCSGEAQVGVKLTRQQYSVRVFVHATVYVLQVRALT